MLCCLLQLRYFDQGRNDFFFAAFKQYVAASAEEAQKVSSCQHGLQQPRLTYRYTDLAQPTTDGIQAQHLLCGLPRPASIIRCVQFCLQGLTREFTIAEVWICVLAVLVARGGLGGTMPSARQELATRMQALKVYLEAEGAGLAHSGACRKQQGTST